MKVTLASYLESLSGSTGREGGASASETIKVPGLVFYQYKGNQVARQKVLPKNPQSTLQVAVRNVMTGLSRAWSSSLTENQRTGWATWGEAHDFTGGNQAFVATAWAPYAYNGTLIDTAPTGTAPSFAATITSATIDVSSTSLTFAFSGVSMDPAQDVICYMEITRKALPGAQAVRDTDYSGAAGTLAGSFVLDTDPTDNGLTVTLASGLQTSDVLATTDRRYARLTVFDLATGVQLWQESILATIQA
jgi:hypothetical protein